MRWSIGVLLVVCLIAGLPSDQVVAQGGQPVTLEITSVADTAFPQLTLFVNLQDEFGVPVAGLTAEDFKVTVEGADATIVSVENVAQDNLPISVVLVIDTSESMLGVPLANAKEAALAFLDNLTPGDEVALLSFASEVTVRQPFTTDLDTVRAAIEQLESRGKTALYEAVYQSAELAATANNPRRMVVLLTDGNQYGSLDVHTAQEGIARAAEQNLAFYVFGIGFEVDPNYLSTVAAQTRGETYFYPDTSTLTSAYDFLAKYLRTNYVITVDTTLQPDGSAAPITLSVGDQTATYDYVTPDRYPQVSIEGMPEGEIAEPVTVSVQVQAPQGLGTNTVDVDGNPLDVEFTTTDDNSASAEITLDPYAYEPGEHILTLSAVDSAGGQRTQQATFTVADLPPVVTISGLDEGAFVTSGEVPIEVQVNQAQQPIEKVVVQIDGNTVTELDTPPYTTTINTLQAGPGQHTLSITVVDPTGGSMIAQSFEVDPVLFVTPTATPTNTPTPTATYTPTATFTATFTPTPTDTFTPEPTVTDTPVPSDTPDASATAQQVALNQTATATQWTATPTDTPAASDTPQPSATPEPSDTPPPTDTAVPAATDTPAPSATPDVSATAQQLALNQTATATLWTAIPTDTPEPSATPTETETPVSTETPDASATAQQLAMVQTAEATQWTATPTDTPTATATLAASETPQPTVTDTPQPTETLTAEATEISTTAPSETATLVPTLVPQEVTEETDEGISTATLGCIVLAILLVLILLVYWYWRRR